MVDKLNSDQTQVDLNETRNKVNEIIDEVDSITIKSYDTSSLPLVADNGSTVLVTDGTEGNTQCMAYYFGNKWYRHFDNTAIELWTPARITTELWLDASDSASITHSSNTVSQWNDKSGKNNHVTASGNPATGSSTQNSLNVIDLDGNDFFKKATFTNPASGDLQVFIVCEVTQVTTISDSIISQNAASHDWQIEAGNATEFYGLLRTSNQTSSSSKIGDTVISMMNIWCASFDYTDDGQYQLMLNGSILSGTVLRAYTNKIASPQDLLIFTNRVENKSPAGKIAEVIIYESQSNSERQQVEGYLAHKWGLTGNLNGSHPYKTNAPKYIASE